MSRWSKTTVSKVPTATDLQKNVCIPAVCGGMAASCNVKLHWIVGKWKVAR